MRRTAVTLLLAGLLMTTGLLVATPASACSCVGGTTQEFLDRADAVFTGRLLSRELAEPPGPISSSAAPAVHLFAVDAVVKGSVQERQEVLSPMSGATCGLEIAGEGPFAVFATRSTDLGTEHFTTLGDDQYAAFLCGGTAQLTPALEAELRTLAGPPPSPSATPSASPVSRASEITTDGPSLLVPAVAGIGGLALALVTLLLVRRHRTFR